MRLLLIALISLLNSFAWAEEPWGTVDLQAAKPMHDKACTSCHIRMYGGACNSQVNSGWFPEDEGNVAAWLNKHYYHFTK